MAIVLHCPCGRKLQIREEFAGQQGQCPACGRMLDIPRDGDPAPLESARPAAVASTPTPAPPPAPSRPSSPPPIRQEEDAEPDFRNLRNHGDGPIPQDADFFAPAPRSIGPLRSAWTTLRAGKEPLNPGVRLLLIFAVGVGVLLLGVGVVMVCQIGDDFWAVAIPIGSGGLAALITWGVTRFSHSCTYVGRDGVARFVCAGSRERLTTQEVFSFRDAVDLRTAQTHYYRNGVYQNTILRLHLVRRGRPQALRHQRRPQQPEQHAGADALLPLRQGRRDGLDHLPVRRRGPAAASCPAQSTST